jgi:hypothetical protein
MKVVKRETFNSDLVISLLIYSTVCSRISALHPLLAMSLPSLPVEVWSMVIKFLGATREPTTESQADLSAAARVHSVSLFSYLVSNFR